MYIKIRSKKLKKFYQKILFKTDKSLFAFLFNFKSFLIGSGTRLQWKGKTFVVTDKSLPQFSYLIRHQRRCNEAYGNGIVARVDSLAECYFLKRMGFKDGDIFLDCGANIGDLKLWFDLAGINITYIGFEPSPIEYDCLVKNVAPSEVHNIGLWSEEGELEFFINSQEADSSLIEPKNYDEIITSKVMRLESFVDKRIKCLKLEAEGAEPEILLGLGDRLECIEFISADLGYERGVDEESTLAPVTNFLLARGFELVDVSHARICALYRNTRFK